MDLRARLVPIATTIDATMVPVLRSISPTPGSQVFILVFDVPSPKCFAQPGDRHSYQARNIGSALEKKKGSVQKYSWSLSEFAKKCPVAEQSFQKTSKTSSKPKAPEPESLAPNFSKVRETKKNSSKRTYLWKKKEMISSFEQKSSQEPRPKHSGVAESLPRPQLVIHP